MPRQPDTMTSKKILLGIALLVIVVISGFEFFLTVRKSADAPASESPRYVDIESYVRQRISELSPEKEVLGGTFHVTKIETESGRGTVEYEDGHNAFTADFTYAVSGEGKPSVISFTIRR